MIYHQSSAVARSLPSPVSQRLRFRNHGTSVAVNDLFGDMPVRVKSRALALRRPDELQREWDHLKHLLVSVMLANDRLERLVLSDTDGNRKLSIRARHQSPLPPNSSQGTELDAQRVNAVLLQAGLISSRESSMWNVVSAFVPGISIHAAFALVPSPTKRVQFISLGMEPLFLVNNTNFLYNEVNRLFALSDFANIQPTTETAKARVPGQRNDQFNMPKSPTKAINRWPMFYIRVNTESPQKFYDDGDELAPESDKSIQRIMDVLGATVNEFLKQHDLRPRATKRKRQSSRMPENEGGRTSAPRRSKDPTKDGREAKASSTEDTLDGRLKFPSFARSMSAGPGQHFGNWSRINGTREVSQSANKAHSRSHRMSDFMGTSKPVCHSHETSCEKPLEARVPAQDAAPVSTVPCLSDGNEETESFQPHTSDLLQDSTDVMIPWTDPHTGRSHFINSRTGQSVSARPQTASVFATRPRTTGSIQPTQPLASSKRPASAIGARSEHMWVENLLRKWDNPAFRRLEKPITSMDTGTGHRDACCDPVHGLHEDSGDLRSLEAIGCARFRGKLSRQHLEFAEVIAQVEEKFVFAKLKATSGNDAGAHQSNSVLVLIDQHAADERCRVEQLFQELFMATNDVAENVGVQTAQLDPLNFRVQANEVHLYRRYSAYFSSWGIRYTIDYEPGSNVGNGALSSLPALIAERCRIEPKLALDLIRREIWKREDNGSGPWGSKRLDGMHEKGSFEPCSWVERLSGCPQGIIDMLNSRACRTAIMFNDVLTVDECQSLVSGLTRCVFPFQCAHGRPSMVPVVDLQSNGRTADDFLLDSFSQTDDGVSPDGMSSGFVDMFRSWRDSPG